MIDGMNVSIFRTRADLQMANRVDVEQSRAESHHGRGRDEGDVISIAPSLNRGVWLIKRRCGSGPRSLGNLIVASGLERVPHLRSQVIISGTISG